MVRVHVSQVAVLFLIVAAVGGCRSNPAAANRTEVAVGETLHGRLPEGRAEQAFTFEGVESSGLDFTIQSDRGNWAAPNVALFDPEGNEVDLSAHVASDAGAATMNVRGVVLRKNGTYKVVATPTGKSSTYYKFSHNLIFPPLSTKAALKSNDTYPIYITAPRRGLIAVKIEPASRSDLQPEIRGVKDPWGGRALDKTQVPRGANPPRVSRNGRTMFLTFTAPRPGRYTILAAAKPGAEGVGNINVTVRTPEYPHRIVRHTNRPAAYGVPGTGTPSANVPPSIDAQPEFGSPDFAPSPPPPSVVPPSGPQVSDPLLPSGPPDNNIAQR